MVAEVEILMQEISDLRSQYVAEVGNGRRVWPRSIKERVMVLDDMGVPAKQISERSGVGYATILQWRFHRRRKKNANFHEVAVRAGAVTTAIAKIDTVTMRKDKIKKPSVKNIAKLCTVTVTTPEGFKIEAPDAETALILLKGLRGQSCL